MAPSEPDSVDEQDPRNAGDEKKQKSRRPANTAFRQQRLKAWQPILTPKTVLPLFFIVGVIFAPIGGLLIWASSTVQEVVIDYTNCAAEAPLGEAQPINPGSYSSSFRSRNIDRPSWKRVKNVNRTFPGVAPVNTTVCSLYFEIPNDIGPSVFLYYRLTNFYQNHRRYVKSLDLDQLKGKALPNSTINGSPCDPLRIDPETQKAYYPCGLIANSVFNDTFYSPALLGTADNQFYEMTNKGISWSSDKQLFGKTEYKPEQIWPPPNWRRRYPDGYTNKTPPPDLHEYEELQVWMRTAGLPTFSKLAMRNDKDVMKAGSYRIDIDDNFPVTRFGGTKSIVLSTNTVVGGKNPFMGIAYVVVGGICIILGALFTLAHLVKPRKLGDHTYLTWNNEQPSTATTTGREPRFGGRS
ncbi:LEM3/CDC50 family protein [Histoplasma ohiense]|nr:LEM3/CDC50 family protein [Histoplasma ohiense (nom. inval.)]